MACRLGLLLLAARGVPDAAAASRAAFVRQHGGLVGGPAQARVERVVAPLRELAGVALAVGVLATDRAGAWAWPSGHVYVSAGLVAAVDDDALLAALAHEIGHLVDQDGRRPPFALGADAAREGPEARADALGCGLLRAGGLRTDGMARVLEYLASQARPGQAADALALRAAAASRRCRDG